MMNLKTPLPAADAVPSAQSAIIRVLIVDDHPLVRIGMAAVINQEADMQVVAEAADGPSALELYRLHRPDVVLLDLRLHGQSGTETAAAIMAQFPSARILVISNYDGDEDIRQALAAGALGYLFKSIVEDELVIAMREVHAGRLYLPDNVSHCLRESADDQQLTRRELDILRLLGKGLHNKEIGQVLGISEDTVKSHLKSLFRKLGASDKAEAVRLSIQRGFLRDF